MRNLRINKQQIFAGHRDKQMIQLSKYVIDVLKH